MTIPAFLDNRLARIRVILVIVCVVAGKCLIGKTRHGRKRNRVQISLRVVCPIVTAIVVDKYAKAFIEYTVQFSFDIDVCNHT